MACPRSRGTVFWSTSLPSITHLGNDRPAAIAARKHTNVITEAHTPKTWKRSEDSTRNLQSFGGANGFQVSVALLMDTVRMTLMTIHMSRASNPV